MKADKTEKATRSLPTELQDDALVDIKTFGGMLGMRSASPIYDRIRANEPDFPKPVYLSRRCTRFRVRDIRSYIAKQAAGDAK